MEDRNGCRRGILSREIPSRGILRQEILSRGTLSQNPEPDNVKPWNRKEKCILTQLAKLDKVGLYEERKKEES